MPVSRAEVKRFPLVTCNPMSKYRLTGIACPACRKEWYKMRRIRWDRIAVAIIGLAAAVLLLTGFYSGKQELVEDVYVVKQGDTLRGISERYLEKNTGGRRYILEFEQGIRELNPALWDSVTIYPGQEIRINYWVIKEGE